MFHEFDAKKRAGFPMTDGGPTDSVFYLVFCASFPGCSQDVRRMFPACSSDVPRMFAASLSVFVTFHSVHENQKTNGFGKHVVIDCLDMSFGEFIFPEADVQHRV